jgi:dihydrofolate reductase
MRKLKLQAQITVDGFISGPEGQMDWLVMNWSDDIKEYVDKITAPVDTILLGRNLAEGFIPHWAKVAEDPNNPENAAGKKYSHTPKVVFSKTLATSPWENTTIAKGELVREVGKLKSLPGSDMIAYGGSSFVSSLIKERLIDELHLFINPAAIGKGKPIFAEVSAIQRYALANVKRFDCGIVLTQYELE